MQLARQTCRRVGAKAVSGAVEPQTRRTDKRLLESAEQPARRLSGGAVKVDGQGQRTVARRVTLGPRTDRRGTVPSHHKI